MASVVVLTRPLRPLQATSSDELLAWLNGAGYDLPSDLDPVLATYGASNQYFVALKLSAGKDVQGCDITVEADESNGEIAYLRRQAGSATTEA